MTNKLTYKDKDGVIRFTRSSEARDIKKQLAYFSEQAGKRDGQQFCISDLIGNAEEAHIRNYKKG